MERFSYQNKVRLCSAIFTALIFLDIIAFFDTLNPIFSFSKRQKGSSMSVWQNQDVKRENISSQNYTRSYEFEKKEEDAVNGEIVHDVALLLVEVLGLAILLVANSYPQAQMCSCAQMCSHAQMRSYMLKCAHTLILSYPHILISLYHHILISSFCWLRMRLPCTG